MKLKKIVHHNIDNNCAIIFMGGVHILYNVYNNVHVYSL